MWYFADINHRMMTGNSSADGTIDSVPMIHRLNC